MAQEDKDLFGGYPQIAPKASFLEAPVCAISNLFWHPGVDQCLMSGGEPPNSQASQEMGSYFAGFSGDMQLGTTPSTQFKLRPWKIS